MFLSAYEIYFVSRFLQFRAANVIISNQINPQTSTQNFPFTSLSAYTFELHVSLSFGS